VVGVGQEEFECLELVQLMEGLGRKEFIDGEGVVGVCVAVFLEALGLLEVVGPGGDEAEAAVLAEEVVAAGHGEECGMLSLADGAGGGE
jgi:hypothetical protein